MVMYRWLADAVVVVHATWVAFLVLGALAILLGAWLRWSWVRNFWFRAIHFLMIAIVVGESLLGFACPLTTWEDAFRAQAGEEVVQGTFIGRLAHDVIFYDAPPWAFDVLYFLFGALIALTLWLVPPRRPKLLQRKARIKPTAVEH